MSEPKQEFLRRGQVEEWLEGEGITRRHTEKLIKEKVIIGAPLPGRASANAEGGRRKAERNGKNGAKQKGRQPGYLPCWFRKSQIKGVLGL